MSEEQTLEQVNERLRAVKFHIEAEDLVFMHGSDGRMVIALSMPPYLMFMPVDFDQEAQIMAVLKARFERDKP